jgi:hypothetical protein
LALADLTGLSALVVSIVALMVACYAVWRGNRNSSAATMLSLNEGFRQGWVRFLGATSSESKNYELAELMNILEVAAAIQLEGSLAGVSGKLAEEYLCAVLSLLEAHDDARTRIKLLRQSAGTFEYLLQFLAQARRSGQYQRFRIALNAQPQSAALPT